MSSRTARARRLVVGAALCLAGALAVAVVLAGGSGRSSRHAFASAAKPAGAVARRRVGPRHERPARVAHVGRAPSPGATARVTHARRAPSPGATARVTHARRAPSPGTLPQTHAFPSPGDRRFKTLMARLWTGVAQDSLSPALPAFFPRAAYVQLKAIPSAASDWDGRLVHDYGLDIRAAHALLGAGAPAARLLRVVVPSRYGHWVPPGVCLNQIGYYEVPNARVVYREHGATHSFGIASMISWRGLWYVVHLGAVLRPGDEGLVDDPADGAGVSAYSGTC